MIFISWSGTGINDKVEMLRPTKKINPEDLLRDFISEYVEFYSYMNKAIPKDYLEACAIFAISAVVGGRVSMRALASGEEKPNVFIILLGASSISHKSTPIKVVEKLLRSIDDITFLSGRFSIEGAVMDLRVSPCGIIVRDEFTGLLADVSKSYVQDLKEFFCELYDRKIGARSTIKYGKVIVKEPCNSFLSATTPDNLSTKLKREDYSGGYLPRHLLVFPEPTRDDGGIDIMTVKDMSIEFNITQTLRYISGKFPKDSVTDVRFEGFIDRDNTGEAYKLFNEWVIVNKAVAKEQREDVEPFYARLVDYFIKLCMIFQLSDIHTEVVISGEKDKVERYFIITKKTVERVIVWMNKYRGFHLNRALRVLSNIDIERVYNIIRAICERNNAGKAQYSEVLRATTYLTGDLRKIINTLEDSNRISITKTLDDNKHRRKPAEFISLTNVK